MSAGPDLRLVPADGARDVDGLLQRVARGDRDAFSDLYDALSSPVYGLARRVVRDPARAEDVAQEVFLEVWRKAPGFDASRGTAKTWVMTIAHRRAVDAVRRSEAQRRQDHHGAADEVSFDEPGDRVIAQEEHGAVRECLDTLTDLQLESVRLAYFNGYTYGEVATLLEKPLPTIKTRMRDGLIRLRDCLEGAR
ncbi:ECF RNA polymerase sigma factor SigK [Nocardioides massiliensis]|uniref:RNA polymerase sigma-70 factor (ECF subfamily) n=1 Tax=Nocardioides massiliensis TaxID=1325935 RepID=A0ABT9NPE5_9ACTN|nr:ECF RNA polymerase sigma factor SigK [Nocardioides massiliensis]MDP9822268.1 RNA polymerase sigma-70 factor (ECF subfamily) [Nocardioides massiliensis]